MAFPSSGTGKQPSHAGPPPGSAAGQSPAPSMIDQDAMAGAAGVGAQDQMLTQTMGQIRAIGEAVKALADLIPMGADEVQQIQQLLKSLVVKAAQGAPAQSPSSMAVPGGGGSGMGMPSGGAGAPGGGPPPPQ